MAKRVLSGVKPSADQMHIGNYYGAVKQFVELQETDENFIFIADWHALTTIHDAPQLRANAREIATEYLACGLDPARTTLFRQSDIPEVQELTWYLACVAPHGLLERAHAYKAAKDAGRDVNMGLFNYPLLMASDILIYRSHLVPVGEDQVQHIEITRDVAQKFNHIFGEVLVIPEARLSAGARVPGVDGQKMSKSYGNTINLFEPDKAFRKQVMGIVTDSTPLGQPLDPDTCTVFALHALFPGEETEQLRRRYRAGEIGYGESKKRLAERLLTDLAPVRERYEALRSDPGYVEDVLVEGAKRARAVARETIEACRLVTGFADPA